MLGTTLLQTRFFRYQYSDRIDTHTQTHPFADAYGSHFSAWASDPFSKCQEHIMRNENLGLIGSSTQGKQTMPVKSTTLRAFSWRVSVEPCDASVLKAPILYFVCGWRRFLSGHCIEAVVLVALSLQQDLSIGKLLGIE
eukprot:956364-Amphidinium_carterae.1